MTKRKRATKKARKVGTKIDELVLPEFETVQEEANWVLQQMVSMWSLGMTDEQVYEAMPPISDEAIYRLTHPDGYDWDIEHLPPPIRAD